MRLRKLIAVGAVSAVALFASAPFAHADKPGPGDKQCIPGQQGNPHPAFKAGVCPNP
jgi:hypothetical protein